MKTLALLKNAKNEVEIILFSNNVGKGLHSAEYEDFRKQYSECKIELKQIGKKYHDRYIVMDYGLVRSLKSGSVKDIRHW